MKKASLFLPFCFCGNVFQLLVNSSKSESSKSSSEEDYSHGFRYEKL